MFVIIACVCAFIIAFALTYPLKALAPKLGFMDIPKDDRRMHVTPIPRIGGLAIITAFLAATLISGKILTVFPYLCAGFIIVVLGVLDDKLTLSAALKILGQTLAGVVLCVCGITVEVIRIFGITLELGILSYPITIVFVIAVTNIYNLIDGLDGLCCGLTILAASTLALLSFLHGSTEVTVCALLFVCSAIGFFPHNVHKAKMFLGDTGAMFGGIMLAALCCATAFSAEAEISSFTAVAVLGIPIFDTAFAIVRRLASHSGIFVGDKKHVHHRLCNRYGHGKAVLLLHTAALALMGTALIMNSSLIGEIIALCLLVLFTVYGIIRFGVYKD